MKPTDKAVCRWVLLFNMGVVVDMVLAVTEIAVTPGTVTEFQFRIGDIGAAANGAAVGVRCRLFLGRCFVLPEGDRAGCFLNRSVRLPLFQEGE